jgi:SnoaL-like domain
MLTSWIAVAALMPWFVVATESALVRSGAKPSEVIRSRIGLAYQGTAVGSPALSALDYSEIQMLYGRSIISFDSGANKGYAFARTFTPDGVLVARGRAPITGHAQLAALAARNASCLQTWLTNLMIEPAAEGAIGWAYIWHIELVCGSRVASAGAGSNSAVKEGGIYRDVIVKTADGWRFKRRSYTPGHTIPTDEKPPA